MKTTALSMLGIGVILIGTASRYGAQKKSIENTKFTTQSAQKVSFTTQSVRSKPNGEMDEFSDKDYDEKIIIHDKDTTIEAEAIVQEDMGEWRRVEIPPITIGYGGNVDERIKKYGEDWVKRYKINSEGDGGREAKWCSASINSKTSEVRCESSANPNGWGFSCEKLNAAGEWVVSNDCNISKSAALGMCCDSMKR